LSKTRGLKAGDDRRFGEQQSAGILIVGDDRERLSAVVLTRSPAGIAA
jgi:hypothetical protein